MNAHNGSSNLHTVTVDDPPFLFHRGEGYTRHRLPIGTTVIYPNPPLSPCPIGARPSNTHWIIRWEPILWMRTCGRG